MRIRLTWQQKGAARHLAEVAGFRANIEGDFLVEGSENLQAMMAAYDGIHHHNTVTAHSVAETISLQAPSRAYQEFYRKAHTAASPTWPLPEYVVKKKNPKRKNPAPRMIGGWRVANISQRYPPKIGIKINFFRLMITTPFSILLTCLS